MKKFECHFEKVIHYTLEVYADDKDTANQKAINAISKMTVEQLDGLSQSGRIEYVYTEEGD